METLHTLGTSPKILHVDHVALAAKRLSESEEVLNKLASHCCLPERSETMRGSLKLLAELTGRLGAERVDGPTVAESISEVGTLGGNVGKLYATCCTPVRKPLYEEFYVKLHEAHLALNGALGIGH